MVVVVVVVVVSVVAVASVLKQKIISALGAETAVVELMHNTVQLMPPLDDKKYKPVAARPIAPCRIADFRLAIGTRRTDTWTLAKLLSCRSL